MGEERKERQVVNKVNTNSSTSKGVKKTRNENKSMKVSVGRGEKTQQPARERVDLEKVNQGIQIMSVDGG